MFQPELILIAKCYPVVNAKDVGVCNFAKDEDSIFTGVEPTIVLRASVRL